MIPKEYKEIKEFQEAFEIATQTAWDKKEMEIYDYIALKEFDEINALRIAEKKGYLRGKARGIEKGIEKGEKQKAIKIAKNLLDILDEEMIAKKTGLSIKEIRTLNS